VSQVAFSNGGDTLAAASHATIALYTTYSCEKIGVLAGHIHTISSLVWTKDDRVLISAGLDGGVYEWELNTHERRNDGHMRKGLQYRHAIVAPLPKGAEAALG
jgi:WD40 repeat protein